MDNLIKQRFLDHLQVANAVMNSDILAQIERIAVEVTAVVPLIASILLPNLSAASKRNVPVCLLSH